MAIDWYMKLMLPGNTSMNCVFSKTNFILDFPTGKPSWNICFITILPIHHPCIPTSSISLLGEEIHPEKALMHWLLFPMTHLLNIIIESLGYLKKPHRNTLPRQSQVDAFIICGKGLRCLHMEAVHIGCFFKGFFSQPAPGLAVRGRRTGVWAVTHPLLWRG